jgi:hypothetical protein
MNNEGWRLVRAECDRSLHDLPGIVDVDAWRKILPDPDVQIRPSGDAISAASGLKSLMAFALWCQRYADVGALRERSTH